MQLLIKILIFSLLFFYFKSGIGKNKVQLELKLKKNIVVLLPIQDYRVNPEKIFFEDKNLEGDEVLSEIEKYVIERLRKELEIDIYEGKSIYEKAQKIQEFSIVARGYLHLGIELYRNLRIKEAIETFKKSEMIAKEAYLNVFEPKLLSEIKLHLAIMYLELKNFGFAHTQFMEMFFYEPQKKFKKNYFGELIEKSIVNAVYDFRANYNYTKLLQFFSPERIRKFLDDFNIESVIYIFLTKEEKGDFLHLKVFEKQKNEFVIDSAIKFSNKKTLLERMDREISKWLTCSSFPSRIKKKEKVTKFYFDTVASHSIYLKYPTRRFFNNIGFGGGFSFTTGKNIDLFSKFSLQTSTSDRYRDLYHNFNNFRFSFGVGFSIAKRVFKIYWHLGPEIQYFGNFEAITDPDCKFFGQENPLCNKNSITTLKDRLLIGTISLLGLNTKIYENLYVATKVSLAAYFIPFTRNIPLNFPFTSEIGVGYMF